MAQAETAETTDSPRRRYKREWQRERRRAAGVKPLVLAPCGTPAAYRRHLRNSEPIDDACRQAWNEQARVRRAKTKADQAESAKNARQVRRTQAKKPKRPGGRTKKRR